jgi:hypothetical protein
MRCYWCDGNEFNGVDDQGTIQELEYFDSKGIKPKDHICTWCGHLVSEGNPRDGDPEETLESVKEDRDECRQQLEAALGERTESIESTT